jgi:hypothetical protein
MGERAAQYAFLCLKGNDTNYAVRIPGLRAGSPHRDDSLRDRIWGNEIDIGWQPDRMVSEPPHLVSRTLEYGFVRFYLD